MFLHLLGFDHNCNDTEAEYMETTEVAVLADFGIANPYDEPELEEALGRSRTHLTSGAIGTTQWRASPTIAEMTTPGPQITETAAAARRPVVGSVH